MNAFTMWVSVLSIFVCLDMYFLCVWVGCNNTICKGLGARAILALSNNKTMIAWFSGLPHSV